MHHPTDRIAHTTVFVIPVVEHWHIYGITGYNAKTKQKKNNKQKKQTQNPSTIVIYKQTNTTAAITIYTHKK